MGLMATPYTAVRLAAVSSWAPQGIIPCSTQENTSSKEAVRRGSTLWIRLMSLAMGPLTMMATVLLAVAQSARETRAATAPPGRTCCPSSLPPSFSISQAMPPLWAIISDIPPQNRDRKNTSFMPVKPFQMLWAKRGMSRSPRARPMMPAAKMPMVNTRNTFMPISASTRTAT